MLKGAYQTWEVTVIFERNEDRCNLTKSKDVLVVITNVISADIELLVKILNKSS